MFRVERLLEILIIATVGLSGLLLGIGQSDLNPFVFAVVGAIAAYVLTDRLGWFSLPQWLANTIAIIVTLFTVTSFFFTGDSVRQLMGVGKLLVYLQTILLFQQKTARVYWQVLVLSLLQIVVGAVFNLGFEGGVLFIVYMVVAGATMMVLHLFQDTRALLEKNRTLRQQLDDNRDTTAPAHPIAVFDRTCRDRRLLTRMFRAYSWLGIGSLGFAIVLFYFLPRENTSWSGPRETPMRITGFSKSMDLNHSDLILLSSRLVMTATYRDPLSLEPVKLREQPYLRGLALSNLVIKDNRTTWQAPYDQVYANDWRSVRDFRGGAFHFVQDIVMEPTEDPILFTAWPIRRHEETPFDIEICRPLSAVTRQRGSETIQLSHFRFISRIPTTGDGLFFQSFPYQSGYGPYTLTPESDQGSFEWLTNMDPQRYPTIVRTARDIAIQQGRSLNHLQTARDMEEYLLDESRFTYTIDYRGVTRDRSIDCVEDFFANHRNGHCEYFASALTLMLRSQGIPARVIVGYRGGNLNEFGNHIDVEERHAHAWVEAYIRPQDCTPEMVASQQAGPQGAWLILDPTPGSDNASGLLAGTEDALGLAKSLWRDYVLGLQSNRSMNSVDRSGARFGGLLRVLDLDWWQSSMSDFGKLVQDPTSVWWYLRIAIPFVMVGITLYFAWVWKRSSTKSKDNQLRPSTYRQRLGALFRGVSPRLSDWIAGTHDSSAPSVPFYDQMVGLLNRAGFTRKREQTQREFALETADALTESVAGAETGRLTLLITESYYRVRFGRHQLSADQMGEVTSAVQLLKTRLQDGDLNRGANGG